MRLFLPVTKVEMENRLMGSDRYLVTLSDGWGTTVEYTTSTQPAVGQKMVLTIEAEK